ncbi:hypothetical protein K439DRAFT_1386510 [Ramaria rubella]|nr:hypothetical protein K439DRAFT_1386510 [Ramaria rubella]
MSTNASRSPSAEPTDAKDSLKASISQSSSSNTPDKNDIADDDTGKDDTGKDDTGNDDTSDSEQKNGDNTDKTASAYTLSSSVTPSQGDWQAIWAPVQNAYYFYNSRTNETTWTNPLQAQPTDAPQAVASTSYPSAANSTAVYSAQAAAEAAGIDPSLAYLDPSLGLPGSTPAGTFTAKFNSRTGAFARLDARDPSHLSESERAKRMSEVYFDVGAWEKELEQRNAEEEVNGKKRKRPSKKDLERFKEQKKQKKIAKTAWLRT